MKTRTLEILLILIINHNHCLASNNGILTLINKIDNDCAEIVRQINSSGNSVNKMQNYNLLFEQLSSQLFYHCLIHNELSSTVIDENFISLLYGSFTSIKKHHELKINSSVIDNHDKNFSTNEIFRYFEVLAKLYPSGIERLKSEDLYFVQYVCDCIKLDERRTLSILRHSKTSDVKLLFLAHYGDKEAKGALQKKMNPKLDRIKAAIEFLINSK